MDWRKFIHSDPEILLGKPVVKGTRLSVEFILGLFSEGWSEQQILAEEKGTVLFSTRGIDDCRC
ncbi:MAG: DUF433 domain-containing protein [Candidatus Kryptoniota bacterium]